VNLERFHPIAREEARAALGLDPEGPYLLFPADPRRPEKRYDRAAAVAGNVRLLALGQVDAAQVPQYVNAVNAVLVPSDREGFGLSVLEALACNVPVLATPVGIHPDALTGIEGTYCGRFDEASWRAALAPHLAADDPRVRGRDRAERFSTDLMAAELLAAWRGLL
jgi:glycosyltransferase involved in cell wall biosynthesis